MSDKGEFDRAALVYAGAIAELNAMNVHDFFDLQADRDEAREELDEADWKIAQIRDALTWINSPGFILNSIKAILKEDA